jgi:AAA+ superfamily predicted ATPase
MVMGIEDFIKDALYKPSDYIAYHVGREIAKLHPGKAIIEGDTGSFDLEAFARAKKCSVVHETSLFNHIKTDWLGPGKRPQRTIENSWTNVLWNGYLLDVVFVTFTERCYPSRHFWIIAEDQKLADEFFAAVCNWSNEVREEVLIFHDGEWARSKELYESIKSASFENLILREGLKREIQNDFTQFFASRAIYEQNAIPWKRGVLFIGPPGNGKTHTVKALVNYLGQPCLYVKALKSEYETDEENIRRVFARARITTPCLLVLEDLDSLIDDKSRAFFLNEMDGFAANTGVVVLATTNYPERLDPAIRERPSRFDRKYLFNLPGPAERTQYVAFWNEKLQSDLRLSKKGLLGLVEATDGFSFAYLKELFLSAMMQWMSNAGANSMEDVAQSQVILLRGQMSSRPAQLGRQFNQQSGGTSKSGQHRLLGAVLLHNAHECWRSLRKRKAPVTRSPVEAVLSALKASRCETGSCRWNL